MNATTYRTLDGLTVVGIEATHYCRGCEGLGRVGATRSLGGGRICGSCEGSGRLLGADPFVWPVPVEPDPRAEYRRRECGR